MQYFTNPKSLLFPFPQAYPSHQPSLQPYLSSMVISLPFLPSLSDPWSRHNWPTFLPLRSCCWVRRPECMHTHLLYSLILVTRTAYTHHSTHTHFPSCKASEAKGIVARWEDTWNDREGEILYHTYSVKHILPINPKLLQSLGLLPWRRNNDPYQNSTADAPSISPPSPHRLLGPHCSSALLFIRLINMEIQV